MCDGEKFGSKKMWMILEEMLKKFKLVVKKGKKKKDKNKVDGLNKKEKEVWLKKVNSD